MTLNDEALRADLDAAPEQTLARLRKQLAERDSEIELWKNKVFELQGMISTQNVENRSTDVLLQEWKRKFMELSEELTVTDKLLEDRQKVVDAIPACADHGKGCVPYALEWIEEAKKSLDAPLRTGIE